MHLDILYQDDYIVAVNKPSGLLSVPGRGADKQDCVVSRLQHDIDDIRVVHRLDCDTSGLMLLAIGADMQRRLSRLFHDRDIEKKYVALVQGVPEQRSGVIDIPLRGDPDNRPTQIVDYRNGKQAQTRWRLLGQESSAAIRRCSRLQLQPLSGRTHQLRLHCMAMGHPIVGDRLYNTTNSYLAERLMLHAERLEFIHPASSERLCLVCSCDF